MTRRARSGHADSAAGPGGWVRPPAVAGSFYPADPDVLRARVGRLLEDADEDLSGQAVGSGLTTGSATCRGIVAPHAGYRYSGPVAAAAFARVRAGEWRRVVVAGPAHRVAVPGVAVSSMTAFRTPLGDVPVDRDAVSRLAELPGVVVDDRAHEREHSIEVELPFLQCTVAPAPVVPLAVGAAEAAAIADVLDAAWDDDTLLVLSTDLSHHLPYEQARQRDRRTADAIVARRWQDIGAADACGAHVLRGLLELTRRRGLDVVEVAVASSGDTAGPRDQVVGYGAFAVVGPRS